MQTNEAVIRKLYAVAEGANRNTAEFISLFAEDGYFYDVPAGRKYYGQEIGIPVDAYASAFPDMHRELFDKNYAFGQTLLASGLLLPALDFCLKCSHLFNVLDASGSIGVTERTAYILRVRQLAVAIAQAWAASNAEGAPSGS